MHGPGATDYPNHTVYLEVEKYKRLVYDHGANDDQPALFRVRVNFSELELKTLMDMTMVLANPSALEETKKMIKAADGNSTWDRLGEYLALITSGKEKFIINRSFDFDIETMFRAWTEPEQLVAWSGPVGAAAVDQKLTQS
jgi:uncharacterized protein YndB with AHSA1/START domain